MSKIIEGEATEVTPQTLTVEQHLQELLAWLKERNLTIVPVAVGKTTGTLCNVQDFLRDTHVADWSLQELHK